MDGWKMSFLLGPGLFSGGYISVREGKALCFYHGWHGWWKETNPYHTFALFDPCNKWLFSWPRYHPISIGIHTDRTIYPQDPSGNSSLFLLGCLVSHDSGMLHQGDRWIRPRNPWPCDSARQFVKRMSWEFLPFEMEHFKMEWRSLDFNRILTFFVSGLLRISSSSIGIDLK